MKTALFPLLLIVLAGITNAATREEWFRNLSLENAIAGSDLIIAAQVTEVAEIKLMRGGKGESAMFQYKFKPVRVLKGVFARDELSLGSSDLDLYRAEDMRAIKQGAFVLIFLGRSDIGYRNSNRTSNGEVAQSMPPLLDANDPLLGAVQTLLAVNAELDRARRVSLLIGGLQKTNGAGAVALLDSLKRRALLAAQDPDAGGAITPHLIAASPAVRESAAQAMRAVLDADYLENGALRELAIAKCVEALNLADPNTFARAAILRALGWTGAAATGNRDAIKLLTEGPTGSAGLLNTIERAAQLRALGDLKIHVPSDKSASFLANVPIDDGGEYSRAAEYAMARIDPKPTATLLNARFDQKLAAGFGGRVEIESFADQPPDNAIPALIRISKLPLNSDEKEAVAETCRKLVEQKPDARLVEPLSGLLTPNEQSRNPAITALLKIDSDAAAKALQPYLREEENLFRKLEIAEMLGRHGLRDGYAFAIEHVSQTSLREQAVAALAAIKEPEAIARLKAILETSHDVAWNTAAVRGLGAMGAHDMIPNFLTLIEDLRNPLAPAALIALADLGERKALDKVREGLGSRNDQVVTASARAAGRLHGPHRKGQGSANQTRCSPLRRGRGPKFADRRVGRASRNQKRGHQHRADESGSGIAAREHRTIAASGEVAARAQGEAVDLSSRAQSRDPVGPLGIITAQKPHGICAARILPGAVFDSRLRFAPLGMTASERTAAKVRDKPSPLRRVRALQIRCSPFPKSKKLSVAGCCFKTPRSR